jgi:hypothetical protein
MRMREVSSTASIVIRCHWALSPVLDNNRNTPQPDSTTAHVFYETWSSMLLTKVHVCTQLAKGALLGLSAATLGKHVDMAALTKQRELRVLHVGGRYRYDVWSIYRSIDDIGDFLPGAAYSCYTSNESRPSQGLPVSSTKLILPELRWLEVSGMHDFQLSSLSLKVRWIWRAPIHRVQWNCSAMACSARVATPTSHSTANVPLKPCQ